MNTRIRPGWARALEVLPNYVGGILEWREDGKTLLAKIRTVNPDDTFLELRFVWTIERDFKGKYVRQTPENTTAPTTMWSIDMTTPHGDADLHTETKQVTFLMNSLKLNFTMHHPDSQFVTELNVDSVV